jgi:hypothetical protein
MRAAVGPTGPELDMAPKLLHDLGRLHAHKDVVTLRAVLHPCGAGPTGEVGRSQLDAISKSSICHVKCVQLTGSGCWCCSGVAGL